MSKMINSFLLEVLIGVATSAILIAWYDVFCERKKRQKKFIPSIILYVVIDMTLAFCVNYMSRKYFAHTEMVGALTALIRLAQQTILEWVLFIGKYQESLKKKLALYVPYIVIIPAIEMFIQSTMNKELVAAAIKSYYINAINDVTMLVAMYIIILIVGAIYRYIKYKKRNPQAVLFAVILAAQLTLHYFFEKVFLTTVYESDMSRYLIGYILSSIILLCVGAIHQNHLKDLDYKRLENERQRSWEQKANYYQTKSGTTTELKKMEHDFKKHLLIISQLSQTNQKQELKDYLNSVAEHINPDNDIVEAGNLVISTILTLMTARCRENDISFKYNLGYKELRIADFDLSIILGNVLENAFEASMKVDDIVKRSIKLFIQEEKSIIFIRCQNYYMDTIESNGKSIKSSKADKNNHGLGLSNVQDAVKHYDGEVDITTAGQLFEIQIILRNPTK